MEARDLERAFPLTPIQLGMLFQALAKPGSGTDIEQIVGDLRETFDLTAFQRAFERVAAEEPRFRTLIDAQDGQEAQQLVLKSARLPWHVEDLQAFEPAARTERFERFLAEDRARGFDLGAPPLSRVSLFKFGPEHTRLVWTVHHILLDGWSFPLVLREVFRAYEDFRASRTPAPRSPPAFHEHVAALVKHDAAADEAFWRPRVSGLAELGGILAPGEDRDARTTIAEHLGPDATKRLRAAAESLGVTRSTLLLGAWSLVLARHAGHEECVLGVTSSGRTRGATGNGEVVGVFINTLPLRVSFDPKQNVRDWLVALRAEQRARKPHERTPLADIQRLSGLPSGRSLFETLVVFDDESLTRMLAGSGGPEWAGRSFRLIERTGYPVTLYARVDDDLELELVFDEARLGSARAKQLLSHLNHVLCSLPEQLDRPLAEIELLSPEERQALLALGQGPSHPVPERTIHELVAEIAAKHPDRTALVCRDQSLDYAGLAARVDQLARHLVQLGVGPDQPVGLSVSRSIEMVVGMLGILRAGGAYVPLDPAYPAERRAFMLEDSGARVLVSDHAWEAHRGPTVRLDAPLPAADASASLDGRSRAENLAYVIYTSGSTGKPKGVMIEHRNVINFFEGMDRVLEPKTERPEGPGTWLAVTSPSFDISVLELLYTLARGFTVVVAQDEDKLGASGRTRGMAMSLFYFASDHGEAGREKYRLLLEGAKLADERGFQAVWTPERHFHAFGGLYPNPSVASAAIAALTSRVQIRAGSVVVPLHDPIRIAEEWSVVDNLSGGRVGISIASGWHPDDFVFAPEDHARRKEAMLEGLEVIQKLWRGESIERTAPGGRKVQIKTLPRPVQAELPVWVTAAGNPETFRQAGAMGANVLTHLLGQTVETVASNVQVYRKAWRDAGRPGQGQVTLMLHTFVGDSEVKVRETVRAPMKAYLQTSVDLVKGFANEWTAYSRRNGGHAPQSDALDQLSPEELDSLLDYAFERFYEGSALFGTPEQCAQFVRRLEAIDVDEVACLIDFGVPAETALLHLEHLDRTRLLVAPTEAASDFSLGAQIRRHHVTHLQCTPSMARMLLSDRETAAALEGLDVTMIGGEAFPPELASELYARARGRVINMYGPTETTIWSSTHVLAGPGPVPIGRPISNTSLWVLHPHGSLMPRGLAGELYIGGLGVVRGYHQRPELNAERFVPDRLGGAPSARLYRTGDLARWREDGTMEFLGRLDHQVKIRGHRIELGEIEAAVAGLSGVRQSVVMARQDRPGDQRLVAYVVRGPDGHHLDAALVKEHVARSLPSFMVPQHVVFMESFPETPNRKIDRKALPSPDAAGSEAQEAYVAPTGVLETELSQIWREVLGAEKVGTKDNFFDLGGHSILAVQVHGRLQKLIGRPMPITDLFRFPTIAALAAHLGGETSEKESSVERGEDRGKARRAMLARRRGEV